MPISNEYHIKSDIKGKNLAPCYLIFGNDGYLKKQNAEALIKSVALPDDVFNFQKFSGDCDLQEVYDAKEQLPMMADKKCVVLKDFDFEDCSKPDFERLLSLCGEKSEDTVFILWFDRVEFDEKRSEKGKKLISACEKCGGRAVLINHRQTGELVKMITAAVSKRGGSITSDVARYLIEYVSDDIETIRNEVEKLCAYVKNGAITKETVNKVCVRSIEQSVYELSGEILKSNVGGALKILDELFFMRVKPLVILSTVTSVYTDLFRVYAAKNSSVPISTVGKDFSYGGRAFLLEKASRSLADISGKQLRLSLDELSRADKSLKSFSGSDRTVLEEMIVRLSYIISKGESVDKT